MDDALIFFVSSAWIFDNACGEVERYLSAGW